MANHVPPAAIRSGIRAAEDVDGVEIINSPTLIEDIQRWAIKATIDAGEPIDGSMGVPRCTEWFVVLDPAYPLGSINIYPSKQHSITATFPHQDLNLPGPDHRPWRSGKLCLDTPVGRLGLIGAGHDPIGNREDRLKWHLARGVAWVRAAAEGTLVQVEDPFELPFCRASGDLCLVHDESPISFSAWSEVDPGTWGVFGWHPLEGIKNTILAGVFLTRKGTLVRTTHKYSESWGSISKNERCTGVWWLWPCPIVLAPWQIPLNWADLRAAGKTAGVDVDDRLSEIARRVRGTAMEILLLGYPIPRKHGGEPSEIHWQAIRIPELRVGGRPPNGFRANELGWWRRDRTTVFAGQKPIAYMSTENWHPDRLQARGRLSQPLRDRRVAIVGCGALGSVVAELLVRGGVSDLLLIDDDVIAVGNLVRHTLSGQEIGQNKAEALARRLATSSPLAEVRGHAGKLPNVRLEVETLLEDREVVVDCTGADDVTMSLALGWWSLSRLFFSASVGYEARRTFLFAHRGHSFPQQDFREKLEPFLQEERQCWAEQGETIEGAGCWSPLFPARLADILLAAASCVKVMEEVAGEDRVEARLVVFQQTSGAGFMGLQRMDKREDLVGHE